MATAPVTTPRSVLSKATTGADVAVFVRGGCFFSKKVESGQLVGYDQGHRHAEPRRDEQWPVPGRVPVR